MKSQRKIKAEKRGRWAERWAALILRLKGYKILKTRFRSRVGEVDLIALGPWWSRRVLVACEVKRRARLCEGMEAMTNRQRQRILRALLAYQVAFPSLQNLDIRFDVMVFAPWRWKHLKNAWSEYDA